MHTITGQDLFGWGRLDQEHLHGLFETYSNLDGDTSEIYENITEYEGDLSDVNTWIESAMSRIFYLVIDRAIYEQQENLIDEDENEIEKAENIISKLNDLRDEFSPFINCIDSHYNNIFDDLDLDAGLDEIISQLIESLDETRDN